MENLALPVADLSAVFVTHFHSDHIADLGELISRSWILGRSKVLPVYGGPAVERIVDGFNLVYSPDEVYRRAHHGEAYFPPDTLPAEARRIVDASVDGTVVYNEADVVVRAYHVDHSPVAPALGYRVEYGGHSVGISGDTIDTPGLRALADSADVLVSEVMDKGFVLDTSCLFERLGNERYAAIFRDIRTYHIDVLELAQLSTDAKVGTLVLTHQVPSVPAAQAQVLFGAPIASIFDGRIVVAEDGTRVTIDVE
jgi:ribonuclease Z